MRILFIQKWANLGGSKTSLLETLAVLQRDDHVSTAVLTGSPGPFVDRCRALGVAVLYARLPEWRKLVDRLSFGYALRRAAAMVTEPRPGWVVSNEMWWAPHAFRLASHLGCRSAVILRDGVATRDKARKYRLAQLDRILCVSSALQRNLAGEAALASKTVVVYDSIGLPPPSAEGHAHLASRLAAFPRVQRWMAVVGSMGQRKNQIDAVRALKLMHDAGYREKGLILAGDCDAAYAADLHQAVAGAGLTDYVVMLGHFSDVTSLYRSADAVLLTSTREGLPRSIVEGLLAGKPAFTYPCEGVDDIFGADARTFVSDDMTPAAVAAKLLAWRRDPDALQGPLERVTARVRAQFSPDCHVASLKRVLAAA